MSLSVYLAAPYATRDSLRPLADELASIGMRVTSTWINDDTKISTGIVGAADALTDTEVAKAGRDDLAGLARANVLVLFTAPTWESISPSKSPLLLVGGSALSGGRHVETGYAIAKGIPVVAVGKAENIFHRSHCDVVDTWHDAVLWLVRHRDGLPKVEAA